MAEASAAGVLQLLIELNVDGGEFKLRTAAVMDENVELLQAAICKR